MASVANDDPCNNFKVEFQGSIYEGLKINQPDELDLGLVNENWAGKISRMDDATTPVAFGYAFQNITTCLDKFKIPGTRRLDAGRVRGHLRELVEKATDKSEMRGQIVERPWEGRPFEILWPGFPFISIDLAISLEMQHWPLQARSPPACIKNPRVQLVPKVRPGAKPALWLISFAKVESQIMQNIDNDGGCRRKVLQLTKYFVGKGLGRWYPLATYHLKSILVHVHMNDWRRFTTDWAQGVLVARFRDLIDRLLELIENKSLSSFFMPNFNLFRDKLDIDSSKAGIDLFLKTLRSTPEALLKDK